MNDFYHWEEDSRRSLDSTQINTGDLEFKEAIEEERVVKIVGICSGLFVLSLIIVLICYFMRMRRATRFLKRKNPKKAHIVIERKDSELQTWRTEQSPQKSVVEPNIHDFQALELANGIRMIQQKSDNQSMKDGEQEPVDMIATGRMLIKTNTEREGHTEQKPKTIDANQENHTPLPLATKTSFDNLGLITEGSDGKATPMPPFEVKTDKGRG